MNANVLLSIFLGICYQVLKRKGISLRVSVQISLYVDLEILNCIPVKACIIIKIIYNIAAIISTAWIYMAVILDFILVSGPS